MGPLFKSSIILFGAKRKMLQELGGVETLVVGSSHGDFGFDPGYCPGSFNLCCRSQDLKHSFHLYRRLCETMPGIRNLVVFYSVFSPGNIMELSPAEREICPALNEIFGLDITYQDPHLAELAALIKGQLDEVSISLDGRAGFFPSTEKDFIPSAYGAERRAADHLKLNRSDEANVDLGQILSLADALGHKVIIVLPPVREDYRQACSLPVPDLFASLFAMLEVFGRKLPSLDVEVLNAFDDTAYKDEFFGDFDHLLPTGQGVGLLTSSIQRAIDAGTSA
ncbi:hypothetical protein ACIPZF_03180 [Pseudomonas sp. NPDC089752]|uniref:hypothetical protein n=1 Tax=Pseudomonas sp. NPDC089752 TaxID=3364472 RepID=UPI00382DDE2D